MTILQDCLFDVAVGHSLVALPCGGGVVDACLFVLAHLLIGLELAICAFVISKTAQSLGEFEMHLRDRFTKSDGFLELIPGTLKLSL